MVFRFPRRTRPESADRADQVTCVSPVLLQPDPNIFDTRSLYELSIRPTVAPLFLLVRFIPFFSRVGTASFRKKVVENFPNARVRKLAEISEALDTTAKDILRTKRAALTAGDQAVSEQIGQGKDIMSVLRMCFALWCVEWLLSKTIVKAQMTAAAEDKMPDNELLGHIK